MGINAESENTLAESLPNIIFSCLPQTLKRLFSVLLYPLSLINPYGELFDGALDRCIGIKGSRLLGSLLQKSADDHEYIPGLWNVGNSCFANVIIQVRPRSECSRVSC